MERGVVIGGGRFLHVVGTRGLDEVGAAEVQESLAVRCDDALLETLKERKGVGNRNWNRFPTPFQSPPLSAARI